MTELPAPPVILLLGHNHRNLELLGQFLQRAGYTPRPAASLDEFCRALEETPAPQLALVDAGGFEAEIWSACETLRQRAIPFLVISPKQSAAIQQAGLERGARGVLVKPLAGQQLLNLIKTLI